MNEKLFRFAVYDYNRYQAEFGEPPPWNPNRPVKYWRDPEALKSPRRAVVYDIVASGPNGLPLSGTDGKPFVDLLVLTKEEAATFNIIPPDINANAPGTNQPYVPVPIRPLGPDEYLDWGHAGAFGQVIVRDRKQDSELPTAWTKGDQAALYEILRIVKSK